MSRIGLAITCLAITNAVTLILLIGLALLFINGHVGLWHRFGVTERRVDTLWIEAGLDKNPPKHWSVDADAQVTDESP